MPYRLTPDELTLYEAVTNYVQNNFARAEQSQNRNVGLALTVLQRRLASSMAAIRRSLERRLKRLQDLRKLGKLKQEYGELPEDMEDLTEAERWKFEDDIVERLTMAENMAELENEIEDLKGLVQHAIRPLMRKTPPYELDDQMLGYLDRLLDWCEEHEARGQPTRVAVWACYTDRRIAVHVLRA